MTPHRPLALASCLLLASCGTLNSYTWPWPDNTKPCQKSCTPEESMKAVADAAGFCRNVQNHYEFKDSTLDNTQVLISWTGALAGSVAAPIAKGSAVKAWSGLSGITNGLQDSLNRQYSDTVMLARRKSVYDAASKNIESIISAPDDNARVRAAIAMAMACALSSASIDIKLNKALLDAASAATDAANTPAEANKTDLADKPADVNKPGAAGTPDAATGKPQDKSPPK